MTEPIYAVIEKELTMVRKRVILDGVEYGIVDGQSESVAAQIKAALETEKVAALELLDGCNRSVTVYLNGKATATVVVDLNAGPKPSEISG